MKRKISNWPRISPRENRSGSISYMVDLGKNDSGKRDRHFFKTKGEAETFAALARAKRESDGVAIFNLSREFWAMAVKASESLEPFKASILDATNYYVEHLGKFQSAPTIKEATDKLLAEMKTNNRRERTISDVKSRLGHFAADFGARKLSEIHLDEIQQWVNNPTWKAQTRIHYLTKLSQFFNFGVRNGYVKENIVERIKRPTPDQSKTELFTVEQAEKLLEHAPQFGLLPYIAIGLFGGLRSAELFRLKSDAIVFEESVVTVGGEVAKKRATRHVSMNDTLCAWLAKCELTTGTQIVDSKNFVKRFRALQKAAGVELWPHNGLRHSYGSYHLATFGDAKLTAKEMGNTEEIVHSHYKALVRKADAERFWALRPKQTQILPSSIATLTSTVEPKPKELCLA